MKFWEFNTQHEVLNLIIRVIKSWQQTKVAVAGSDNFDVKQYSAATKDRY
jgi:hypothetical protein